MGWKPHLRDFDKIRRLPRKLKKRLRIFMGWPTVPFTWTTSLITIKPSWRGTITLAPETEEGGK